MDAGGFFTENLAQKTPDLDLTALPGKAWGPIVVDGDGFMVLTWKPYNIALEADDVSERKTSNIARHQRRARAQFKQRNFTVDTTKQHQEGLVFF